MSPTRLMTWIAWLILIAVLSGCGGLPATSAVTATPAISTDPTPIAPTGTAEVPTSAAEPIHVLILGDSIGIPRMGCGSCEGFDAQYATLLEAQSGRPVKVDNQARPNARIQDLQSVVDTETGVQELIGAADIVIVTIGYNNGPNWDTEDPCHAPVANTDAESIRDFLELNDDCVAETLELYGTRLEMLYDRIEVLAAGRSQVRVTLGVYANLDGNPGGDGTFADITADEMARAIARYNATIDKWNVMDCAAALPHGFVCGDIHRAFNGPDGTAKVAGLVNPSDYIHPNVAGQAKIAELLEGIDVSRAVGN